jgi:hypothetical protein
MDYLLLYKTREKLTGKGKNRCGSLNINAPFRFKWRPEIEQLGQRRQMSDGVAHLQEPIENISALLDAPQVLFSQTVDNILGIGCIVLV